MSDNVDAQAILDAAFKQFFERGKVRREATSTSFDLEPSETVNLIGYIKKILDGDASWLESLVNCYGALNVTKVMAEYMTRTHGAVNKPHPEECHGCWSCQADMDTYFNEDHSTVANTTVVEETTAGIFDAQGSTKDIIDLGDTESIVEQGSTEDIVEQGNNEDIVEQGNNEDIVEQGSTEDIVEQGNNEDIVEQGNTEDIVEQGSPEDIVLESQGNTMLEHLHYSDGKRGGDTAPVAPPAKRIRFHQDEQRRTSSLGSPYRALPQKGGARSTAARARIARTTPATTVPTVNPAHSPVKPDSSSPIVGSPDISPSSLRGSRDGKVRSRYRSIM